MNEILIRFNDIDKENPSEFLSSPFDVFIDGEKVPRLKRIEIDFKKYVASEHTSNWDDFKYRIEQFVDVFGMED